MVVNQVIQNPIPKLRQISIISKKQVFFVWQAPTTIDVNIFCWNFAHVFYLVMSTEGCARFFLFCLDLETKCVETMSFLIFANNSKSNQSKK